MLELPVLVATYESGFPDCASQRRIVSSCPTVTLRVPAPEYRVTATGLRAFCQANWIRFRNGVHYDSIIRVRKNQASSVVGEDSKLTLTQRSSPRPDFAEFLPVDSRAT